MPTRKQIRDAAAAQIGAVYAGEIGSGRIQHPTQPEFVEVYFEEGVNTTDGLQQYVEAIFTIAIYKSGLVTDDDLDDIGAQCEQGLLSDESLGQLIHGMTGAGFEYEPRGESQFDALYLRYQLTYDQ